MMTLDTIRKPVTAELEAFDEFVAEQFTAEGELLSNMLRYALSSRGKGIRPLLVMLSAAMNASVKGASRGRRVSLAAMLVEMIHVASLIHDDVIDESDTRRGRPSVNARWQSHRAVILGDYILARNMAVGLQSGQFDLVTHICGAMAALCEGEVLQGECADKHTMTRQTYLDIIYKKTASLIGVCASAGALAVGAPRERVSLMRRFGEALGMAFQIQDDLLDYTRDAHTGKPANNDLREGKITLPLLAVLDRADEGRREDLLARLARCHEDEEAVEYLRRTVENEGGLRFASEVMHSYVSRAVDMLSEYEPSPYRSSLVNLCTYVVERDR
ncbi:polyprenyl synthetase family protein [Alistipes sp.]|uniref:polyprenyl synthetase family protein n=1 Tax=Alistipes sp. TaxID=1872444 RepID=UPI003AF1500F